MMKTADMMRVDIVMMVGALKDLPLVLDIRRA
jgi:hypothetical protein